LAGWARSSLGAAAAASLGWLAGWLRRAASARLRQTSAAANLGWARSLGAAAASLGWLAVGWLSAGCWLAGRAAASAWLAAAAQASAVYPGSLGRAARLAMQRSRRLIARG